MWGDDFSHQNGVSLDNARDIISGLNQIDQGKSYHVEMSSVENYFKSVHEDSKAKAVKYQVHTKDFWKYDHSRTKNAYWSGFYSNYPEIKREIGVFSDFV